MAKRRHHHHHRNPRSHRNPKGGGMGIGTIALIGVGAYFVLSSGMLSNLGSIFGGQSPITGYTPIGGNAYRNNTTGQVVYRQATGQLTSSPTGGVIQPTGGAAWAAPLVQSGVMAIPAVGLGLANMIRGLFGAPTASVTSPGNTPAGTVDNTQVAGGGTTTTAPDILSGAYTPPPPAIPEPGVPLSEVPAPEAPGGIPMAPVPTVDLTLSPAPVDLTPPPIATDTTAWYQPTDVSAASDLFLT